MFICLHLFWRETVGKKWKRERGEKGERNKKMTKLLFLVCLMYHSHPFLGNSKINNKIPPLDHNGRNQTKLHSDTVWSVDQKPWRHFQGLYGRVLLSGSTSNLLNQNLYLKFSCKENPLVFYMHMNDWETLVITALLPTPCVKFSLTFFKLPQHFWP